MKKRHLVLTGFVAALWMFMGMTSNAAVQTFKAVADTYGRKSKSDINYGTHTRLDVQGTGTEYERISYLKFDVSGLCENVDSATLRVWSSTANTAVTAYAVADSSWSETNLTWSNRPPLGSALDTVSGSVTNWYEWDVTSAITADGTHTFGLASEIDVLQRFKGKQAGDSSTAELVISSTTTSIASARIAPSPYPTLETVVYAISADDYGIDNTGSTNTTGAMRSTMARRGN